MNKNALDKTRERQLIALQQKGQCSSLEILEADFCQWPPKGLDIVNPPTGTVKFRPAMLTSLTTPRHWPSLFSFSTFVIWLVATRSVVKATLASIASNLLSTMGFIDTGFKDRRIHVNELVSLYGRMNKKSEFLANVISHEHLHLLQNDDHKNSLTSAMHDRLNLVGHMKDADEHETYLAHEAETQARLHTTIVNAYQQHKRMPENVPELLAALYSQGLELSESVLAGLSKSREGRIALKKFPRDEDFIKNNSDTQAAKELNKVAGKFSPRFRTTFWTVYVPKMYGDLIELYGDSLGSARLGLGHNIQLRELFYKQVHNLHKDPANAEQHLAQAAETVSMMPDDQARELKSLVAKNTRYKYGTSVPHSLGIPVEFKQALVSLFDNTARHAGKARRLKSMWNPGGGDSGGNDQDLYYAVA